MSTHIDIDGYSSDMLPSPNVWKSQPLSVFAELAAAENRRQEKMIERFWVKVDNSGGEAECWLWTSSLNGGGYGAFNIEGKPFKAHRVAYELTVGPIPDGLVLDHLCKVKACVNPAHLEPVPQSENIRRGNIQNMRDAQTRRWAAYTHCIQGHELTEENVYRPPGDPRQRQCRPCKSARDKKYRRGA